MEAGEEKRGEPRKKGQYNQQAYNGEVYCSFISVAVEPHFQTLLNSL